MTTIARAIDFLAATAAAHPLLPTGCQVWDGYALDDTDLMLVIGSRSPYAAPNDDEAAPGAQSWGALGAKARHEDYTIACYASSYGGDVQCKPRRDQAAAILRVVEAVVVTNPQLSLVTGIAPQVASAVATVVDVALHQVTSDQGRMATFTFGVNVKTTLTIY